MWTNPQETADLLTFTKEILNEKLHFCAVPLMTTLIETHALMSRKYIPKGTMSNLKQSKHYELLWLHYSVFALEHLASEMIIFLFFYLQNKIWLLLIEKCVNTSPDTMGQDKVNTFQKYHAKHKLPCSHSSNFALQKQPKKAKFSKFFNSERTIGGYFQWNACIHFQEIYSWRRYKNSKTITKTWITLVTLLRFCFRIIASKLLIC